MNNTNDELRQRIVTLEEKVEKIIAFQQNSVEKKLYAIENHYSENNNANTQALLSQIDKLTETITHHKKEKEEQEKIIKELSHRLSHKEEYISQLEIKVKHLNQRIEDDQIQLGYKENQIHDLSVKLHETDVKINQYHLEINNIDQYQALIYFVQHHQQYANEWSIYDNSDSNLERLIANLAQWDNIERLWDNIANRCKASQEPVTSSIEENTLLSLAVKWFNMTCLEPKVQLLHPTLGDRYNYEIHQKHPNASGETISEVLLSGLTGPDGRIKRNSLINTTH